MQPMGLFRKMRGPAGKKGQKLSDEIYSVLVAVVNRVSPAWVLSIERVEQWNVGKNELAFFQT